MKTSAFARMALLTAALVFATSSVTMDAFARGLKIAAAIRKDGRLAKFVKDRYASWDAGLGAQIEGGKAGFAELEAHALKAGDARPNVSGRQEFLENLINEFI